MELLYTFLIFLILSLIIGILLSVFSIIFKVEENTLVEDITKLLPGYNCGACGFPGCNGFANHIVTNYQNIDYQKELLKCKPGKAEVHFKNITEYLKNKS